MCSPITWRLVHERDPAPNSTAQLDDDWDVELKVLGQVRSVGTKEPLTPTELHLAIYLAFHGNGQNSDTISAMVWPKGAAPRTITNTMASLRRKLGTGTDGEMLFPLGRDNQYVYRLSPRVVTDWDRFIALTKRADRLPAEEAVALLDRGVGADRRSTVPCGDGVLVGVQRRHRHAHGRNREGCRTPMRGASSRALGARRGRGGSKPGSEDPRR